MCYHLHINFPSGRITVHNSECGHWKKWVGTERHKHGDSNSMYIPNDAFGLSSFEDAEYLGKGLAKEFHLHFHRCAFCCSSLTKQLIINN